MCALICSNLLFKISKHSAFSLYELDWDVFGVHIDSAVNRCPILAKTGIKSTVCGPESFTPDHKPILGIIHQLGINVSIIKLKKNFRFM